jgi:hypothetical protein
MSRRAHRRCDNFRESLPQAVAIAASMCRMLPECRASSQMRRRRLDHEVRQAVSIVAAAVALLLTVLSSGAPKLHAVDVPALQAKS